jgi:hypothetical protein
VSGGLCGYASYRARESSPNARKLPHLQYTRYICGCSYCPATYGRSVETYIKVCITYISLAYSLTGAGTFSPSYSWTTHGTFGMKVRPPQLLVCREAESCSWPYLCPVQSGDIFGFAVDGVRAAPISVHVPEWCSNIENGLLVVLRLAAVELMGNSSIIAPIDD